MSTAGECDMTMNYYDLYDASGQEYANVTARYSTYQFTEMFRLQNELSYHEKNGVHYRKKARELAVDLAAGRVRYEDSAKNFIGKWHRIATNCERLVEETLNKIATLTVLEAISTLGAANDV
jgi:hypothetical protein